MTTKRYDTCTDPNCRHEHQQLTWAASSNSSLEVQARMSGIPYMSSYWADPVGTGFSGDFNPRNRESEEKRRTALSDGEAA